MNAKDNNMTATVSGSELTIKIDLSKNLGRSKSGKSDMIASTRGFQSIDGGKIGAFSVSLNLIQK